MWVNGPICVFGVANIHQARVEVEGDATQPIITTDTVAGKVTLDTRESLVRVKNGVPVILRRAETDVLGGFLTRPGIMLSHLDLRATYDNNTLEEMKKPQKARITVHVYKIREALRVAGDIKENIIGTVFGSGYRLNIIRRRLK